MHSRSLAQRPSGLLGRIRAFTLLELIVCIVILAILAAIAIPTFAAVIASSQDKTVEQEVGALLRNATANAALSEDPITFELFQEIVKEQTVASTTGTYAAGETFSVVQDPMPSTKYGEVSFASGTGVKKDMVGVAMLSPSGNCVFGRIVAPGAGVETWVGEKGLGENCRGSYGLEGPGFDVPKPGPDGDGGEIGPPVTGLVATPGDGEVTLTWDAVPDANGYRIYRNGVELLAVSGTTYRDRNGIRNGLNYVYHVAAFDERGNWEKSDPAPARPMPPQVEAPEAPQVTLSPGSTADKRDAAVSWNAVLRADGYYLYKNGLLVGVTGDDKTSVNLKDAVVLGQTTTFGVEAFNLRGAGSRSPLTSVSPVGSIPVVPENLELLAVTGTTATVRWQPSPGATFYRVYVDGLTPTQTSGTQATIPNLTPDTSYLLTVTAGNVAGESPQSAPLEVIPDEDGGTLGDGDTIITKDDYLLRAVPSHDRVGLTWTNYMDAPALRLYRDGVSLGDFTTTAHTDLGLAPGSIHTYQIFSLMPTGTQFAPSEILTVTTRSAPSTEIPLRPQGLTAEAQNSAAALSWTASAGAQGYRVYQDGVFKGQTSNNTLRVTALQNETTYSFTVSALNANGESAQTEPVLVTPKSTSGGTGPSIPLTPASVAADAGDKSAKLTWSSVSGASGYRVYKDGIYHSQTTATNRTIGGLVNGTTYSLSVSAFNAAGESGRSTAVTVTPTNQDNGPIPNAPTNLQGSATSAAVSLTWSAPSEGSTPTGYRIYRNGSYVRQSSSTSANFPNVTGTANTYTVSAYSLAGESQVSGGLSLSTPPPAPVVEALALDKGIRLGWTQEGTVSGWTIYLNGTEYSSVGSSLSATTINGLTNGTDYQIRMKATSTTGDSALSAVVTVRPVAPPNGTPSNLQVTNTGNSVFLDWNGVSGSAGAPVSGYGIYRDGKFLISATTTSYTDATAPRSATVLYSIDAYGSGGRSGQSAQVSLNTPPATPTGLTATIYENAVSGTWNSVPGATSYKVYRDGSLLKTVSSTGFTDADIATNATYDYRVSALNAAGESLRSTSVTQRTPPSAPVLSAAAYSNRVELSWTTSAGATGYYLYRITDSTGARAYIPQERATSTVDSTVVNGLSYTYYVEATNVAGSSQASNMVRVVPNVTPPNPPIGVTATFQGSTWVPVVTWSAPTTGNSPTGYYVYKNGSYIATVTGDLTYTGTALTPAESATFSVASIGSGGVGSQATATALVRPGAPDAAPTSVQITSYDQELVVNWTGVATSATRPVGGYHVYVNGASTPSATATGATATSISVTGLTNGQTYTIEVAATGTGGTGPRSASVTGAPTPGWSLPVRRTLTTNVYEGGAFEWFGKQAGANNNWTNPYSTPSGLSITSASSSAGLDRLVNQSVGESNSYTSPRVTFDLGSGVTLQPDSVFLQSGSWPSSQSVIFEGSNDGTSWTPIRTMTANPGSLLPVTSTGGYRYLQFRTSGGGTVAYNEVEFYGMLRAPSRTPLPSAPVITSVTPGVGAVTAAWEKRSTSSGFPIRGHRIYSNGVLKGTVAGSSQYPALTFSDTTASQDIQVSAYSAMGEGPLSAPINVRPHTALETFAAPASGYAGGLFDWYGDRFLVPSSAGTTLVASSPMRTGAVIAQNPGITTHPAAFVDGVTDGGSSVGSEGLVLDLGSGTRFQLSTLVLYTGLPGGKFHVEGSNDGVHWTSFRAEPYEVSFGNRIVNPLPGAWSQFRIRSVGTYNTLAEMEFYGSLAASQPVQVPSSMPVTYSESNGTISAHWTPTVRSNGVPVTGYNLYVDGQLEKTVTGAHVSTLQLSTPNGTPRSLQVSANSPMGEGALSAPTTRSARAATLNFTRPTGSTVFQPGIIDWYAKNKGTTSVWSDPASGPHLSVTRGGDGVSVPLAVDQKLNTAASTLTSANFIQVDFGTGRVRPDGMLMQTNPDVSLVLEGSMDGTTWAPIQNVSPTTSSTYLPVTSTTAYRFLRVIRPGSSSAFGVRELEFYGGLY